MKIKTIWTNYKIYAFIMGIVTGTMVYNALGMDFSFSMIHQIIVEDYWDTYYYLIMLNLRFWILVFCISFFTVKDKVILLIIFMESFVTAGMISMSIQSKNMLLLYGVPMAITKMLSAILMFDGKRPIINRVLSVVILIVGTALENFFLIKF